MRRITGKDGSSFPRQLSGEEEARRIEEMEHGTEEERKTAQGVLAERNLRLVAHIAKKFEYPEPDELISVGSVGLMKAIGSYRSDKKTKFSTYAAKCIENEILMFLRSSKKRSKETSINAPIGTDKDGNDITLEDKLTAEDEDLAERAHIKNEISRLQSVLPEALCGKELPILKMRYGLDGGDEMTQREVAAVMGISRSYVSRIENRALAKLAKKINRG
jgi:RNA polymerase sporulation-specific sigma factor